MNEIYNKFKKGSEWRKWDLHLHTPYTNLNAKGFNASDEDFIQRLKDKQIEAVALTNYFFFKDEEFALQEKLSTQGITAFLNLELRASYTNKEEQCCDIHIIFSDDVSKSEIDIFRTKLHLNVDGSEIMAIHLEPNELTKATVDFKHLLAVLNDPTIRLKDRHFLGFLSRGHGDGRSSSNFETLYENCDFLLHSSDEEHNLKRDREFWLENDRPLYQSSDAHNLESVGEKFSWIKADTTFEGLKQVMYEPEERISLLKNKPDYKQSYLLIDSIELNDTALWSGKIELSENLNTIIGGRSTGKSSLLSTIARKLGSKNSTESKNYEFITDALPNVRINWKDGQTDLNRDIEFFPQSYMNMLAFEDDKRNKLVESIIKKKDTDDVLGKHSRFIIEQKSVQENLVSDIFRLKDEVDVKAIELSELGDKSGVNSEISRLNQELATFQSELSEGESVDYEATSSEIADLNLKIDQVQKYVSGLSDLESFDFFALSEEEYSRKLSHPIFGDVLSLKFTELKTVFESQWKEAVKHHGSLLQEDEKSLTTQRGRLKSTAIYKKGQEHLGKNVVAQELTSKLKTENKKLTEIENTTTELEELQAKLNLAIDKIAESHTQLKERAQSLSDDLCFEQNDLAITVSCPFDQGAIERILEDQLNRIKHKDLITSYVDKYDENPESTVKKLIGLAIDKKLYLKGSHTAQSLLNQTLCLNTYKQDYELTYQNDTFNSMSQGKQAFVILKLLLEFNEKNLPCID
ncbi:hypothetical protein UB37_18455 [Photobacterium iliopiscarium]|uniref:coiled-coil domain-containing protein n=1 Tax=Photobacterium iliopiscarium TaxID=56192 RepID=UPI0005D33E68|nr:hypothetical protein [Photobacterium iliopiscarium]KJG19409.1 hypothetical protein UB37_18455 [Photobacterium iliopiscarium]